MAYIKRENRRGSHVGVILSFVIFVSFVVFVYIVLQPTVVQENKDGLLEFVKNGIVRESSASLVTGAASIPDNGLSCVQLEGFFSENDISERIIAKDENDNTLEVGTTGSGVTHLRLNINGGRFFRFYTSNEFEGITSSSGCDPKGYFIGGVKNDSYVFESKIGALISKYNSNYSGLASDLGIPSANGFSFSFNNSEGIEISTGEAEVSGTGTFAKDFPIQYVTGSTGFEIGKINVRVW